MPTPRRALPTDITRMIALYRDTIHRVKAQHYTPGKHGTFDFHPNRVPE